LPTTLAEKMGQSPKEIGELLDLRALLVAIFGSEELLPTLGPRADHHQGVSRLSSALRLNCTPSIHPIVAVVRN